MLSASTLSRALAGALAILLCFACCSCGASSSSGSASASISAYADSLPADSADDSAPAPIVDSVSDSAVEDSEPTSSQSVSVSESSSSLPENSSSLPESSSSLSESSSSLSESSSSLSESSSSLSESSSSAPESAAEDTAPAAAPNKEAVSYVLSPSAPGDTVLGNSKVDIDVSNKNEGYCCVRYTGGGSSRIKVLMTKGSGNQYQYNLNTNGSYEVFPFSSGSGSYQIGVYQNVSGNQYAQLYSTSVDVSLRSSFLPFLYPNQYVNFNSSSSTVKKGAALARTAANDLEIVSNVYNYVINNFSYDFGKAGSVTSGYLPKVDNILSSGLAICFDYSAVMAAMLRTQQIPTKLVIGYSGKVYHAWISTYITDVGWVNGVIYFDGQSWQRMDPTFADGSDQSAAIMKYINNNANYSPMFNY